MRLILKPLFMYPLLSKQRLCPSSTQRWFRQFLHRGFWRCIFQLVLRCPMCAVRHLGFEMHDVHILCQGRGLGHDGLRSIFCPLVCPRIVHHVCSHVPCTVSRVSNTRVQATLGVGSVNFRSFIVAWTRGGRVINVCGPVLANIILVASDISGMLFAGPHHIPSCPMHLTLCGGAMRLRAYCMSYVCFIAPPASAPHVCPHDCPEILRLLRTLVAFIRFGDRSEWRK